MYPSTVGHTDENVSRRYLQGMYGAIPIVNDAEFAAVLENLAPQEFRSRRLSRPSRPARRTAPTPPRRRILVFTAGEATEVIHLTHLYREHRERVAVIIPSQSLGDPTLPGRVQAHAEAFGVPACMLTLEVTEGELMEDARTSRAVMTELRALGFRVSIDDFGTGHSSLAYLHTLPVDELKIDRAFVQRIGTDATSAQIVHVIVELAHTFGLQTVAEGIETDTIHDALRDLGVELRQGFLMSRPARAAELTEFLRRGYRTTVHDQDDLLTPV